LFQQLRSCWYVYWLRGIRVRLKHVSVKSAWEASFRSCYLTRHSLTSAVFVSGVCSVRTRAGVMATFQVNPPDEFDFGRPESWPQWFQPFERFRAASDMTNKDQPFQVNALLYAMGPKSEDILPSLVLTADEKTAYVTVTKRLNPFRPAFGQFGQVLFGHNKAAY